jgi:hypothetical protein
MKYFTEDGIELKKKDENGHYMFVYFSWDDLTARDSISIMNLSHAILATTDDYIFIGNRCGAEKPCEMFYWNQFPDERGFYKGRVNAEIEGVVLRGIFHDRKKAIQCKIDKLNTEIKNLGKAIYFNPKE